MPYQYTCLDCGATAETDNERSAKLRKYCPECSRERHRHVVNRRREGKNRFFTCHECGQAFPLAEGETTQRTLCDKCKTTRKKRTKAKKEKRQSNIAAILAEAKAHGMSYGKYLGWRSEQARIAAEKKRRERQTPLAARSKQ